jgi:hypothetical protein
VALSASFIPLHRVPHSLTYSGLNPSESAAGEHSKRMSTRINCFNNGSQLIDRERFNVKRASRGETWERLFMCFLNNAESPSRITSPIASLTARSRE